MTTETTQQGQQQGGEQQGGEQVETFKIGNVNELMAAVNTGATSDDKSRSYTKEGFKGLNGLSSLSNARLATMAAACMRQIARNGNDDSGSVKDFLGTNQGVNKNSGVIAQYGPVIVAELSEGERLNAYNFIASEIGIPGRQPNETVTEFATRVNAAKAAKG